MIDVLFFNSPKWLDRMYEKLDERITLALERDSCIYQKYRKQIDSLYEEHPDFIKIIEGSEEHKPMLLNGEETKKLSELVRAEFDIMEMYQRLLYIMGIWDGIRLAEMMGAFEEMEGKKHEI